jgi:pimeloyl-ACP methyl ester carboxylesterase
MYHDARAIGDALEEIDGPVAVVGHSYGGVPVTQAVGDAANVVGVVYLAAFMLDVGESLLSAIDSAVPEFLDGVTPLMTNPRTALYSDLSEAQVDRAIAKLVPQSLRSFGETVTTAGWRAIPSTYVVCTDDLSIPPALQEFLSTRAAAVERLPSGHSPFLSMPSELAN